jgi:hypothetical protein
MADNKENKLESAIPTSELELMGKRYVLCYDFNAMSIIQEETGRNPFGEDMWEDLGPKEIVAFLHGFLNTYHPELTKKDVGRMIHFNNAKYVMEQLMDAWDKAIPDKDEAQQNPNSLSSDEKKRE